MLSFLDITGVWDPSLAFVCDSIYLGGFVPCRKRPILILLRLGFYRIAALSVVSDASVM